MTRRDAMLCAIAAWPATALPPGDEEDSNQAIADIASALANANSYELSRLVKKDAPGSDEFLTSARVLMDTYEITSSIRPTANEGDNIRRNLTLDWQMQLKARSDGLKFETREATVKCTLVRDKKRWLLEKLDAGDLFRAPKR